MKYLTIFIFLSALLSCNTIKWRKKYAAKHMMNFVSKYSKNDRLEATISAEYPTDVKTKRKYFKKSIRAFERGIALVPDSVEIGPTFTDSFYVNPNKIDYILKHKLKSPNMYFLH